MHPAVVSRAVTARPFRPFVLHLAGGRSFPVPSPECIRMPEEGRLVIVYPPSGSSHVIDLFYVTDVEFPRNIVT
jgi:hypothetical protein